MAKVADFSRRATPRASISPPLIRSYPLCLCVSLLSLDPYAAAAPMAKVANAFRRSTGASSPPPLMPPSTTGIGDRKRGRSSPVRWCRPHSAPPPRAQNRRKRAEGGGFDRRCLDGGLGSIILFLCRISEWLGFQGDPHTTTALRLALTPPRGRLQEPHSLMFSCDDCLARG
jgi:hypothetical protein